jgi:hypothetical protein
VLCEKHPSHEITHYNSLNDEFLCMECFKSLFEERRRHVCEFSNAEIEKELGRIGGMISE